MLVFEAQPVLTYQKKKIEPFAPGNYFQSQAGLKFLESSRKRSKTPIETIALEEIITNASSSKITETLTTEDVEFADSCNTPTIENVDKEHVPDEKHLKPRKIKLPACIKGGKPGVIPNIKYIAREADARRKVNTASTTVQTKSNSKFN